MARYRTAFSAEECPVCYQFIGFGLWRHIVDCAKQKEQREAARRAVENGRKLFERLRKDQPNG